MLLLITTSFNITIQEIVQFLLDEKLDFVRVNVDELIQKNNVQIEIIQEEVFINNFPLRQFDKVICWKTNIEVIDSLYKRAFPTMDNPTLAYKSAELKAVLKYLIDEISDKIIFGYPKDDIDKLSQNKVARKAGLFVPETIVTNNYQRYSALQDKEHIVKPISKTYVSEYDKTFVEKISDLDIDSNSLPTTFPFMIQQAVKYDFEVRIFHIQGKFFGARLLKEKGAAELDYRYNQAYRFIPYQISDQLKSSLLSFIEQLHITSASFDLLIQKEKAWFLESNPTGNFIGLLHQCKVDVHRLFSAVFK